MASEELKAYAKKAGEEYRLGRNMTIQRIVDVPSQEAECLSVLPQSLGFQLGIKWTGMRWVHDYCESSCHSASCSDRSKDCRL